MADEADREQAALDEVIARLTSYFSGQHSAEAVRTAVVKVYESFKDRPVRDFVPVLVENAAKQMLRDTSPK